MPGTMSPFQRGCWPRRRRARPVARVRRACAGWAAAVVPPIVAQWCSRRRNVVRGVRTVLVLAHQLGQQQRGPVELGPEGSDLVEEAALPDRRVDHHPPPWRARALRGRLRHPGRHPEAGQQARHVVGQPATGDHQPTVHSARPDFQFAAQPPLAHRCRRNRASCSRGSAATAGGTKVSRLRRPASPSELSHAARPDRRSVGRLGESWTLDQLPWRRTTAAGSRDVASAAVRSRRRDQP